MSISVSFMLLSHRNKIWLWHDLDVLSNAGYDHKAPTDQPLGQKKRKTKTEY